MRQKSTVSTFFNLLMLCVTLIICSPVYGQNNASIKGRVVDAVTGEGLPGANVIIESTSIGTATDIYGNYSLRNLQSGNASLKISYMSYKTHRVKVTIKSGQDLTMDFKLNPDVIQSKEVVVTAQAKGQTQAINQQLSSNAIVNVVSSARIQEVPDANAAESVGRLPGVSVLRSDGEGNQVVIRGLAPQYNNIEVAGVKMASTDPDNRSVDLSMISPYMLEGIEVTKAITPDMDADALGGTVNFKLKQAPEGLKYDFLLQGGYNDLKNSYSDYKIVASGSNRFWDNKLGVFAQVDIERRNRNSNNMGAGYELNSPVLNKVNPVYISSLGLTDVNRVRNRYGGTLVLDYQLPEGSIIFNNFMSFSKTDAQSYNEDYEIDASTHTYTTRDLEDKLNVMTNSILYTQDLELFSLEAGLSHSYSEQNAPDNLMFDFTEPNALTSFSKFIPPYELPKYAVNNLSNTDLADIARYNELTKERNIVANLDLKRSFTFLDLIAANVKVGGKYSYLDRTYDYNSNGGILNYGSGQGARDAILNAYPWMKSMVPAGSLFLTYPLFIDKSYSSGTFLKGRYTPGPVANIDLMRGVVNVLQAYGNSEAYRHQDLTSSTYDYSGNEYYGAGYAMTDLRYSTLLQLIAGVRFEEVKREYTATRGNSTIGIPQISYTHSDTTTTVTNDNWLPMVHLKFKPLDWFDMRFAYTNTLSRPAYSTITPREDIGNTSITWHNFNLKPAHSENFDLYFSFHEKNVGLLTAGVFNKRISDMIFSVNGKILLDPASIGLGTDQKGKTLYTYENNPNVVKLWGMEYSWQTNFWYLPAPFNGIVLDMNYTHIHSEAKYPRSIMRSTFINHAPWIQQTQVDTFYTARMISQPDDIANIALGYDYKGLSLRVSLLYQSNIFTSVSFWPELRENTADYWRWDLSLKQELPWEGCQLYLNITNLSRAVDKNINSGNGFSTSEQYYGRGVDLGLRYRIK